MKVFKKRQKISKKTSKHGARSDRSKSAERIFKFGRFSLDKEQRLVLRDTTPVALTPKVFDVLMVLVENRGCLVAKEKLLNEVWPGTFVEEANLSVSIANLRKALGDTAGSNRFIETVSKRGYRFNAKVVVSKRISKPAATGKHAALFTGRKVAPKTFHPSINSLAVLPFENGGADPDAEYLSDGLTESIISILSQVSSVRVVARNTVFRYKGRAMDPLEIGRELGVRSVLTGRILRLGDRVIIRTELVDTANGWEIWGGQYLRTSTDIVAVQNDISEEISRRLEFQLTREEKERLTKRFTDIGEAYHLYLKGRYSWNKFTQAGLRKAVEYFWQAIEIDPTYALAYAGLADSYYRLSNAYSPTREEMPKAKAAAMKAVEIDEGLSEAHSSLGLMKMFYEWDWLGAREELTRAIEINPNNALARQRFGMYFNLFGRFDEATRELQRASAMDPLSPQLYWSFALSLFLQRRHHEAIEEIERTLELDGDYQPALYLLGRAYTELGQLGAGIAVFKKLLALNDSPMFRAALGHAYALAGELRGAQNVLDDLQAQSKQRYVSAYHKAAIRLALDDQTGAFSCLEEAYQERCEMMSWLKVDPAFDGVRNDFRFTNLIRRVGLDHEYRLLEKCAAS